MVRTCASDTAIVKKELAELDKKLDDFVAPPAR